MLAIAIPVWLSILALHASLASHAAVQGRRQALRVGIDQQTRLIVAGDKPTVTPGTLSVRKGE